MREDLQAALAEGGGVVSLRRSPGLRRVAGRRGLLQRVLPTVLGVDRAVERRVLAVPLWHPAAVVCGSAAARITRLSPAAEVGAVGVALPGRARPREGYELVQRAVPGDLVADCHPGPCLEPVRVTVPVLTAVDAAATDHGTLICEGLRNGLFSPADVGAVFAELAPRRGDVARREVITAAARGPWSVLELALHRLLRDAGLTGWRANHRVLLDELQDVACLDVAFEAERVALEVDGFSVHGTAAAFEPDRIRQNAIILDGWTVLR